MIKVIGRDKKLDFAAMVVAFMVLWESAGGFNFAFNGITQNIVGGRLGWLFLLVFIMIYFYWKQTRPEMFIHGDKKIALAFVALNVMILFISFIIGGSMLSGSFFIYAFMGWVFLNMNEAARIDIFDSFLTLLIPLLCCAIIEYLIFIITGNGIIVALVERRFDSTSGNAQVFLQLMFNFVSIDASLPRFQAFFEEPGGVGNLASLALFLTGDNPRYRFAHIVMWIAGIISFSLGFYLLAACYLLGRKIKIKYLIVAGLAILVFIKTPIMVEMYENLIVGRVQNRSIEEIDNRSSDELDRALEISLLDGTIWLGHGGVLPASFQYYHGVSGGKPFVYKYGLIMTLFALGLYIKAILNKATKYKIPRKEVVMFLAYFLLSFYKSAILFLPFFVLMFFLYPYSRSNLLKSKHSLKNNIAKKTIKEKYYTEPVIPV